MSSEDHAGIPATLPQRLTRGFLALIVVVALYALSIGPTLVVTRAQGFAADGTWGQFYAPLYFVASKTQTTYWMLQNYTQWWIVWGMRKDGEIP